MKEFDAEVQELSERIISRNPFRQQVFNAIPDGARRILDFGCHEGALLLRLRRDKQCRELFGIDIDPACASLLARTLDGSWQLDLGQDDADLGPAFAGYFEFIIAHDVIEHLYDPWLVLTRLRRYLSPTGRLLIVTPNPQYWKIMLMLARGSFPYGAPGGLMNEEHIRWFPLKSFTELLHLSGLAVQALTFMFAPGDDPQRLLAGTAVEFPPGEMRAAAIPTVQVRYATVELAREAALHFSANKIMACCRLAKTPPLPVTPVRDGSVAALRAAWRNMMRSESAHDTELRRSA